MVTNVIAPCCPFNNIRILLYRLCGFSIGNNVFIGMHCYLDDMCYDLMMIGNNVTISYGVFFACHGKNQGHNPIVIEDNAYIGMRSSIISTHGVRIGTYAIVGACTLVNKDIPKYSTVVGIPCRLLVNKSK